MQTLVLLGILIVTVVIVSIIYYGLGIFKKISITSIEEMNESEMLVSDEGELEENFLEELVTEGEAKTINIASRMLFLGVGSCLWTFMGLTAGGIAYSFKPSDLLKLLVYILVYIFFMRIPFGILNKTIERSYELKVMPDKLVFVTAMILSYIIGINYFESFPDFMRWHVDLVN